MRQYELLLYFPIVAVQGKLQEIFFRLSYPGFFKFTFTSTQAGMNMENLHQGQPPHKHTADCYLQANGEKVVLIVEDHPLYASSLANVLPAGYRAVFASDANAMRQALQREQIFIALLDVYLGDGVPGITLAKELVAAKVKTIIISGMSNYAEFFACLDLGVLACLPKTADATRIRDVILKVSNNEDAGQDLGGAPAHNLPEMTRREISIFLKLVANPDISTEELIAKECVCKGRVRNVVSVLLEKFDVPKRSQIAKKGLQLGYFPGMKLTPPASKRRGRKFR